MKESAKRWRLLGLLEELVTERRKVLVFSQFVEMLCVVEADAVARDRDYAMLHGQRGIRTSRSRASRGAGSRFS